MFVSKQSSLTHSLRGVTDLRYGQGALLTRYDLRGIIHLRYGLRGVADLKYGLRGVADLKHGPRTVLRYGQRAVTDEVFVSKQSSITHGLRGFGHLRCYLRNTPFRNSHLEQSHKLLS